MYTYIDFSNDIIAMAKGEEMTQEQILNIIEKAEKLKLSAINKANYSATHKSPSKSKASEETKDLINKIQSILTTSPQTATDISKKLNIELTPLRVANCIQYIPNVTKTKVIRSTINSKGLKADKEYTAYMIA